MTATRPQLSFSAVATLILLALTARASGDTINYDFENGTLEGWTNVKTNADSYLVGGGSGPPNFAPWQNVTPHSADGNSPETTDGTGANGVWQVAPNIPSFTASASYQDNLAQTLVLTSRAFTLDGTGSITFALTAGTGVQSTLVGSNFNTLPTATSNSGFEGLALRNSVTGAYILSQTHTENAESYLQFSFSNSALAAAGVLGNGTILQLDLVNTYHGGWGWVGLDNVTITGETAYVPEPSSFALGSLAVVALVFARRKARSTRLQNRCAH